MKDQVTEAVLSDEWQQRLLLRAKSGRPLKVDDVMAVVTKEDLSVADWDEVRAFLHENSIPFDDGAPIEPDRSPLRQPLRRTPRTKVGSVASTADAMNMYLKEIGNVPLLDADQEIELAQRIAAGVEAANRTAAHIADGSWMVLEARRKRNLRSAVADGEFAKCELTAANLRLVVSIAKRYTGGGVSLLDLIQEGNIGLMRAVEKFDASKGFKFSTYATWWIRQAVSRSVADQGRTIRVPMHMVESINRVSRTRRDLVSQLEREPTVEEIAEESGLPCSKVEDVLKLSQQGQVSLDSPIRDGEELSVADFIADQRAGPVDVTASRLLSIKVRDILSELSERESEVLRLRFGLDDGRPRTHDELSKRFGVTRERVRQIESKTLAKLRHPLRSDGLRDYLN